MLTIYEIEEIRGVGDKLIKKIIREYGSYEKFEDSIRNYDIEKLMNIQGISQKIALDIIRKIHDNSENEFLKTEQSEKIYDEIINRILDFSNTDYARTRVLLLKPTTDYKKIKETQKMVSDTIEKTSTLDYDIIQDLYQKIRPLNNEIKAKFDDEYAIVCEDYEDYISLIQKGFDKYCNVFAIEDNASLEEFEFIIYLYNDYNIDPGEANNIIAISNQSEDYEIQPNITLEYYKQNRPILENVYQLREYLGLESCIGEALEALDAIKVETQNQIAITEIIDELKEEINETLKNEIKKIELDGDEILQLLNNEDLPPKIKNIFDEILSNAREELSDKTGILFDPFIMKYPIEIDQNELKRVQDNISSNIHIKKYEQELNACSLLERYGEEIKRETREIIEYDYPLTLARFSKFYDLTIPQIKNTYHLEGSLHLTLKQDEKISQTPMQKINYSLDEENNIILLTGANSGGKTTLLETIGQHCIMAHMGLGVCSENATIAKTDEVHYFTKKHSLNAGAFETFITSFIPVTIGKEKKLVLIDELESITELEAAIKIIIGFIEHIQNDKTYAIIVTHMAPEILKRTDNIKIRTDGIEAKGLDENYNLIVDRTPKINYLANSTPELIIKKIYEKSEEPLKSVYKDILEKF
ncbi:MAG TPA: AAA family ATPase [Methanosphaera sp.]|nr:AAA family ATPase [Methanosphaera sp.]